MKTRPLLQHPDLTSEQVAYARSHPGQLWAYRRRPALKPTDTMVVVDLPEIDEPKILTRQRLVQACINHGRKYGTSKRLLVWLVECCWSNDLLIIERGLTARMMGVVVDVSDAA